MSRLGRGGAFGSGVILGVASFGSQRLSYENHGGVEQTFPANFQYAQRFVAAQTFTLSDVQVSLNNPGGTNGAVVVGIYAGGSPFGPFGTALASASVSGITGSGVAWYTANVTPTVLTAGTEYWVVVLVVDQGGGNIGWENDNSIGGGGLSAESTNNGSTWHLFTPEVSFLFRLDGSAVVAGANYAVGPREPAALSGGALGFYPVVTTLGVNLATVANRMSRIRRRSLSRYPGPVVVDKPTIPPNQQQMTWNYGVNLAIDRLRRRYIERRFPLQGWSETVAVLTGGLGALGSGTAGDSSSSFGRIAPNITTLATGFTPTKEASITLLTVELVKLGAPSDNVVIQIQSDSAGHPSGTVLASARIPGTSVSSLGATPFTVAMPCQLVANTPYWVVFTRDGALDNSLFYGAQLAAVGSSLTYPSGTFNGTSWTVTQNSSTAALYFNALTVNANPVYVARFLGPRPPLALNAPPPQAVKVKSLSQAIVRRQQAQQRAPKSLLFPPATAPRAPPLVTTILSHTVTTRPRPTTKTFTEALYLSPAAVPGTPGQLVIKTTFAVLPLANRVRRPPNWDSPAVILQTGYGPPTSFDQGIDFRATAGFVSDPTNCEAELGTTANYPRTTAQGNVVGWEQAPTGTRDRNATFDGRIAGCAFKANNNPTDYRFDLPSPGPYKIQIAAGDAGAAQTEWCEILDGNTVIAVVVAGAGTNSAQWFDASGVQRIGNTAWVNNEQPVTLTFATSICRIRIAYGAGSGNTALAHARVTSAGSPVDYGGALNRAFGPRVPQIINPLPSQQQETVDVTSQAVRAARPRKTHSFLSPPTVVTAAQTFEGPVATLARTRPRAIRSVLPEAIVSAAAFVAPPLTTSLVVPDRIERRRFNSFLTPPTVLQTFGGPAVELARTRPRRTSSVLRPPATLEPESVQIAERTIRVALVRTRPRHTVGTKLNPLIFYAQTSEIGVTLVHARPRPTARFVARPTTLAVFYGPKVSLAAVSGRLTRKTPVPALAAPLIINPLPSQRQETVQGWFVRSHRPQTRSFLSPPAVTAAAAQTFDAPATPLARIRPRKTRAFLQPPTVVIPAGQIYYGPPVHIVQTRPRPTLAITITPATLEPEAVQIAEREIRVVLTRSRPRPTHSKLAPPTTLQTFKGASVELARIRPRRTIYRLAPPTVIRVPSVEQREDTIIVSLVRTRPRFQAHHLIAPVTYPATSEIQVTLVRTRPRPTAKRLTFIRYAATGELAITLTRTRPRPTTRRLTPPTVLQTFEGPATPFVRIRSHARSFLSPPTVIRVPSVEQREDTIVTALVRTRPRPTTRILGEPTVLQVFTGPEVTLVRARPRPTTHRIELPTVVRVPSVEQREDTITVALVRTRPRPTVKRLRPPTVVRVPSVEQAEQTIRVELVRTRPRPTTRRLAPPTVIVTNPPVVTTILVRLVSVRTRVEQQRYTVEHFLRPPTKVIPLPTLDMQTVQVSLVRTRPRPTIHRLTAITYRATSEISVTLVRAPRQRTRHALTQVVYPQTGEIQVTQTRTRPRQTHSRLSPPTVVRAATFNAAPTPLTRIRPPRTHSRLFPPATLEPAVVELAERTIRVSLARIRPRPTVHRLTRIVYAQTGRLAVSLTHTRPRPTTHKIVPPTATERVAFSAGQPTLTRTRPARTHSFLAPPTVVAPTPLPTLDQRTIKVWLAAQPRVALIRRAPHLHLPIIIPPTAPIGFASLTDLPANAGSLSDEPGAAAAISDVGGGAGEISNQPGASGSLTTIPGAAGELSDEHGGL